MSNYYIYIKLDPYLAQWFIHENGGTTPVCLKKGSQEHDLLKLFLEKAPESHYHFQQADEVAIALPYFKNKDPRNYNYLPKRAMDALKDCIRTRFTIQLWEDLHTFGNIGKRNDNLIYAWMHKNGIEDTETNWNAISKIYYRKRKVYLNNEKIKEKNAKN